MIGDNGLGYGLTLVGGGNFVLSGGSSNTYAGATTLVAGTLDLSNTSGYAIPGALFVGNGVNTALVQDTANNQIYHSATVTVNNSGTLNLNNHSDAFFGLSVTGGTVETGTGLLTLYGNVTTSAWSSSAVISGNLSLSPANNGGVRTFTVASGTVPSNGPDLAVSANISGSGAGITKAGAGTLALSGTNTYTGATTVNAGTLLVNGSQSASAVTVNSGGILGGTSGTVGTIAAPGGTISPGAGSAGTGILNSGSVTFSSTAAYNVVLDGTTAGSGYDELDATGAVTIGSSTALNVTLGYRIYSCGRKHLCHHHESQRHFGNVRFTPRGCNIRRGRSVVPRQL